MHNGNLRCQFSSAESRCFDEGNKYFYSKSYILKCSNKTVECLVTISEQDVQHQRSPVGQTSRESSKMKSLPGGFLIMLLVTLIIWYYS